MFESFFDTLEFSTAQMKILNITNKHKILHRTAFICFLGHVQDDKQIISIKKLKKNM